MHSTGSCTAAAITCFRPAATTWATGVAFTDADRVEDIGRVAERSSWWAFGADIAVPRQKAHGKRVAGEASSSEVLEDTPLEECARHGPKGLNERRLPADPECGRCLVLRSAR